MIAFGVSIAEGDPYRRYCEPGLQLAREPDSQVYVFAAVGQAARTYNLILETAARRDDLEALVLVHPHTRITDASFCDKVRGALAEPEVAVVGPAGASGVRSIAWWEGELHVGSVTQQYHEYGGGELPAFSWKERRPAGGEVDAVGDLLMVLSPWAVRNVRFDEVLALGYGYDVDYCKRVRAAGRKVMTADLAVTHYQSLDLIEELLLWIEAHIHAEQQWEARGLADDARGDTLGEEGWKRRARLAEAQREAARSIAYGSALTLDARVLALERALRHTEHSLSWKITEPLRRINQWRRQRRERRGGSDV
jgi:hypothetical protein